MNVLLKTDFKDLKLVGRGKVRDIYDLGEHLLIVTTDRLSAFDVILPTGIPKKGYVLTQLSKFWFEMMEDIVENHIVTTNVDEMPVICQKYKDELDGRSMLVKKAKPFMAECVVRGYLSGSGWKDYQKTGAVCGIKLPEGLRESEKLPNPIFTPATKAEVGLHDENIDFDRFKQVVGEEYADTLKNLAVKIYLKASEYAAQKGIIIADTKMEFGLYDGKIIIIDELLTPDSSRFWFKEKYEVGKPQQSMDKQYVRDYLETLDWDKTAPGPELPEEVASQTSKKYLEIMEILTK
jgi:phosphoribosylaminoimidazole-succinocarboxamide synthase